jgi:hypothetical protein
MLQGLMTKRAKKLVVRMDVEYLTTWWRLGDDKVVD